MIPPHSLDAEQAVLGCALVEQDAVESTLEILKHGDFFEPRYALVYSAIKDLATGNRGIDVVSVALELSRRNQLEQVGGAATLTSMVNLVTSTLHVRDYADQVKQYSTLRRLITKCNEVVADCYAHELEPKVIIEKAESAIYRIAESSIGIQLTKASDILHDVIDGIEAAQKRELAVTGVPTGFPRLDALTSGLQPGNMVTLAARPGVGKSAMSTDIARHVSVNNGTGVAFFSLEMTKTEILMRMLSAMTGISNFCLRTGSFPPSKWVDIGLATDAIADAPLYVDSTAQSITPLTIRTSSRKIDSQMRRAGKKLGLIVIDYLQLIATSGKRYESRQAEVADVSRSLKALALDLNVPILALSQLNRQTEDRTRDGKPRLSDLRESGSIEQDSDLVMFLWREAMYKTGPQADIDRSKTKLIIAKHRNGPQGDIDFDFRGEITSFLEEKN